MSISEKPSAYGPILRAILNRAMTAPAGITLEVNSESEATQTRQRLYKVRDLENKNIRERLGAEYAGPWDQLRILVKEHQGKWFIILTKDDILLGQVNITDVATGERLGTAGELLKTVAPPQPALKDPFEEEP